MKLIKLTEAKPKPPTPPSPTPTSLVLPVEVDEKINKGDFKGAFRDVAATKYSQLFIDKYLAKKFQGKEDFIKPFKDDLIRLLVQLEFDNHPLIEFLLRYIDKYKEKFTAQGFRAYNNIYAKNVISDIDLLEKELTPLLMSDIFTKNLTSEQIETMIETYKNILYNRLTGEFNIKFLEILSDSRGKGDAKTLLNYDDNGVIKNQEKRKILADMVMFKEDEKTEDLSMINKLITNLQVSNEGKTKTDTSKVTLKINPSLKPSEEAKFDSISLKDIKKEDIPAMLRYLINKKTIE